jgi:hypothetical protein
LCFLAKIILVHADYAKKMAAAYTEQAEMLSASMEEEKLFAEAAERAEHEFSLLFNNEEAKSSTNSAEPEDLEESDDEPKKKQPKLKNDD